MNEDDFKILVSLLQCLFIVVGISGNIISVIVWSRGYKCSKTSFSIYFKLLAVSDIAILLLPGIEFLLYINPFQTILPRATSTSACRFFNFCLTFGFELSAWITVMLTAERSLVLCFPLKFYKFTKLVLCRKYTLAVLCFVLISINLSYIFQMKIVSSSSEKEFNSSEATTREYCSYGTEDAYEIYTITFLCVHNVIPITISVICNIIIIVKLNKSKNLKRPNTDRRKIIKHLTILTVSISIAHCISTLPDTIVSLLPLIEENFYDTSFEKTTAVANLFLYLNSSVNCLMYCFVGEEFRQDLKRICSNLHVCSRKHLLGQQTREHKNDSGSSKNRQQYADTKVTLDL